VTGLTVTSGFFRTLGVTPLLGRDFRPDEEGPTAQATVMLSHSAWQPRFGASHSALIASYIPARRAASVNPIEVLRAE
jgi:hypothetical protein